MCREKRKPNPGHSTRKVFPRHGYFISAVLLHHSSIREQKKKNDHKKLIIGLSDVYFMCVCVCL